MNEISFNKKEINESFYKSYLKKINLLINSKSIQIKEKYQIIIMAAGKGSRMKINYPKPLYNLSYPYGENSLIGNILYTLEKVDFDIFSINIIINEDDEEYFNKLSNNQIRGTAVCLYESIKYLNKNLNTILIWGDLAIFPKYILTISLQIKEYYNYDIIFPTKVKMNPYVSFLRCENGNINKVLHSNEGTQYNGFAEQDCSCFIINPNCFNELKIFVESFDKLKEVDFIHFIPYLSLKNKKVIGIPIVSEKFVSGINSLEKSNYVQKTLDKYEIINYSNFFLK